MTIPYGRQSISDEDIAAVAEVLRSDFLTQGPAVPAFEAAVAARVGARHALAVNSATSALHVACLALGLGPGDWLWTVPNTFVASANCGLYCGASVDFVDIDPVTWNMSVTALRDKLIAARAAGRLPKVVVPVHFSGEPCDMAAIAALAREFGFRVIEDASHAIGADQGNRPVGSSAFSDITVFSFHPVKIVTTGEGGMAVTNDDGLAQSMALLRSHGITRDPALMTQAPDGPWYYQQVTLGFNYRMTDIQAALGLSQMARLDAFIARRHEIADRYDRLLAGLPVQRPLRAHGSRSALHLYIVRIPAVSGPERRDAAFSALRAAGVGVNLHYIPVHLQPWYQGLGFRRGQFPQSERYYAEAITLPLYPALTEAEQDFVVRTLAEAIAA